MFSWYCILHPASHKTIFDIRDVCARPETICASFSCSGMPLMSRSHVCVELSLNLSGRSVDIGLISGCNFLPVFLEGKHFLLLLHPIQFPYLLSSLFMWSMMFPLF